MGKPAARLLDMTAHGGMITGPGCSTVLIGKMPAARMTDMHTCPMVTPPAVPHVGGLLVGPVPPTVFIGKLPAACVGDMALCVGPPSTVLPPGCPTVFLGQSGGGGGGGGGGSAASAASARPDSASAPTGVEGLEVLPVDIQKAAAEAAKEMSPQAVALMVEVLNEQYAGQGSGGEKDDESALTIADIVDILEAVEREEGYEAARHFASYLDYGKLTEMTMAFTQGHDTNPDNDPQLMPTRFMILYGAEDAKLEQIDDHPDLFDDEEHEINVANLRKALILLGYEVAESGPYDDEVFQAHFKFLARMAALGEVGEYDEEGQEEGQELSTLTVRLDIDPSLPEAQDDIYTLYSSDRKRRYEQRKTVKDDADSTNNTLELVYGDVDTSLSYTLEVDPGGTGEKKVVFRNRPFGDW